MIARGRELLGREPHDPLLAGEEEEKKGKKLTLYLILGQH